MTCETITSKTFKDLLKIKSNKDYKIKKMGNRNSSPPPATAADIQRATMISTANSAALASSIVERIPIQNTTNTIQKYIKSSIQPCKCPNI